MQLADTHDRSFIRAPAGRVARTLASWIVETPAQGSPKLRVVLVNPGQNETVHTFNYLESKVKPEPHIIGKRVFIGEYGF